MNKATALKRLHQRVFAHFDKIQNDKEQAEKNAKMGSGNLGDKIRTYRFQDDRVVDHITGKKMRCNKIMKGYFDLLWN